MSENEYRLGIGGNKPPLSEVLADTNAGLIREVEEMADKANAAPRQVKTEDDLVKVGDVVTSARALAKRLDKAREAEKEPFLTGGREVDAFFRAHANRLDRIASVLTEAANEYQRAKLAAERQKAAEEARKLREAEEKKRQEAEEAKREATAERKHDEADEIAAKAAQAESAARASARDLETIRTDSGLAAGAKAEWTFEIEDYEAVDLNKLRPYFKREEIEKAIRSMLKVHKGAMKLPGVRVFEDVKANFRK